MRRAALYLFLDSYVHTMSAREARTFLYGTVASVIIATVLYNAVSNLYIDPLTDRTRPLPRCAAAREAATPAPGLRSAGSPHVAGPAR